MHLKECVAREAIKKNQPHSRGLCFTAQFVPFVAIVFKGLWWVRLFTMCTHTHKHSEHKYARRLYDAAAA